MRCIELASKEKKHFIVNMVIMTLAMFVMRIMGMLFNIYYTSVIGAKSTGMYHLLFSCYGFFVTFSVAGCGMAATRLVSEAGGCVNAASRAVKKCISVCLPASLVATLFAFAFKNTNLFFDNGTSSVAIMVLSLSLVPTAIQSVYRGYFMAVRSIATVTVSQLTEELSQMIFTVLLLNNLNGTPYAYISMIGGISIGAWISFAFDFCMYRKYTSPNYVYCESSYINIHSVTSIAFPVALGSLLRSLLVLAENMLIPSMLFAAGIKDALGEYGVIKGMSIPLMVFPSIITTTLSTMLVTELSERNSQKKVNGIRYIASKSIRYTLLYGFFICGMLIMWHTSFADMFYNEKRVGLYLGLLSLLVIPMYLDTVVDGMLKGLNQQMSSLKYNITDSLLRVGMILCIVPMFGSIGYISMLYISELFNLFLSYKRLSKVSKIPFELNYVTKPLICTAISIVASKSVQGLWGVAVYVCTYLVCTFITVFGKNKQNPKK